MKNLKSLKNFKEEGLELTKNEQSKIKGQLALASDTSYLKPTQNSTECGDCNRFAKTDNGRYIDPEQPWNVVVVAGVDADQCHF